MSVEPAPVMNCVSMFYQHKCYVCRRTQQNLDDVRVWIHPVCGHIICQECQSSPSDQITTSNVRPCPKPSLCLYHHDVNQSMSLCSWPSHTPQTNHILTLHLSLLMSQRSLGVTTPRGNQQKLGIPPGGMNLLSSLSPMKVNHKHEIPLDQTKKSDHLSEMCGNCHKQGGADCIMAIDLECLIGMCVTCFGYPKGHEDHARDKLLRLLDKEMIGDALLRILTEVFTTDVVKRVASALYSDLMVKSVHQRRDVNVEEGKVLDLAVKPVTVSFLQRMVEIKECGDDLLSMYNELYQAYNDVKMLMRPDDKTSSESSSIPHDSSLSSIVTESKSCPELVQFLQSEGMVTIECVLSRLEGMVAQRLVISDNLDYIIMLLGLPSATALYNDETEAKVEDEQQTIKMIQDAFKEIDLSCPKGVSKAILIVRTLKGIRGIIEGDEPSLELDRDGLEILGLNQTVNELILVCQDICQHYQILKGEEEIEMIRDRVIKRCDVVNKMLSIEAVYSAMEQTFPKSGASRCLNEGLEYMLAEGEKDYDGAKALAVFDLAMSLGNKEAMFRKAQMLLDGRIGVKRDATLAVTLFEELKAQGLYLPEIYYYLSKHALEKSFGRTAETYQLVSEYFTKILEMKYDDSDATVDHDNNEGEERKDDGGVDKTGGIDKRDSQRVDNVNASRTGGIEGNDNMKPAILFAQAGIFYIYASIHDDRKPYFRRQFPSSIRQWFRTHNLLDLCLQAKEAGCKEPELYSMLGYAYYRRKQGGEEGKVAIENLTMACSLGISSALHTFGNVYSPGVPNIFDCPKDPKKALSYYLQAEAIGYYDGGRLYTHMAQLYWDREDDEKDGNKVLEYFNLAIRHGDELAYYWKARLYTPGSPACPPLTKCDRTAHEVMIEAVRGGNLHPLYLERLSDDYALGRGVDKDWSKAVYYLKKSIEYGRQRMYQWLGKLYDSKGYDSLPYIKKDDAQALRYYLKEAEMEVDEDGFDLPPREPWLFPLIGSMYEKGRGIPIDNYTAGEYYKKAGEKGVEGLTRLGRLYDTAHTDVPYPSKDDVEARRYYEAADILNTKKGDLPTYLGSMYRDGRGGDVDGMKAMKCYAKAVNLGWYDALYEKAIIFDPEQKVCPPYEKDEERAVGLYLTAEAAGVKSKELMLALAGCFEQGRYVKKDEGRAYGYRGCA